MAELKLQPSNKRLPKRILVVVGNTGMGDTIEALPVFEMIRKRWPSVHVAAGYFREKQKPILEMLPLISETVRLSGRINSMRKSMRGLIHNIRAMRGYDRILFLHKHKKDTITWPMVLAARLAGGQALHKHGHLYRDERRNPYSVFPEHVFFQIATSDLLLQIPLTHIEEPRIILSEKDEEFAGAFFASRGIGQRPVVFINTNSPARESPTGELRRIPDWGIERYAQVANALVASGADVLINGGSNLPGGGGQIQRTEFESVAHLLSDRVFLSVNNSPRELAAIIAKCDLYVGAANGPASVAMAVQTPTVILVGPGERGYPGQERVGPIWWPRGDRHMILSKFAWCKEHPEVKCQCYPRERSTLKKIMKKLGVWKPLKKTHRNMIRLLGNPKPNNVRPPCLEAITVEEVVKSAIQQLQRGPKHKRNIAALTRSL